MLNSSFNSSQRLNEKVVFMCGAPHSGSTLLGLILGSHPDCFYSGEANNTRLMQNPNLPVEKIRKISCKICGINCPVWYGFTLADNQDLYEQLSKRTQKSIIIDSSKELRWLEKQVLAIQDTSSQPFLIFLKRDGRAVINSKFRKRKKEHDFTTVIQEWIDHINQTQAFFDGFKDRKIEVRYEELATEPEQTVSKICNFLDIDYHAQMLRFYQQSHHPIGGNVGTQFLVAREQGKLKDSFVNLNNKSGPHQDYYKNSTAGISLDLRWQQELTLEMLETFEAMAGELNQAFKWESQL